MADEWWTHGYPGGPLVPVAGFPRALYPADAAPGHTPSTDGPDIEAYKRTVSRAGRWRWQKFDRQYSIQFAHGKTTGGVAESGVAGTQKQGNISPASGWIGETTFNLFRSIRIPEGLPHAGEPAMDANAQTLIAEAYAQFQPAPPAPRMVRELALAEAEKYIGVTESPAGSNQNQFGAWYGMNGVPWCAIFCSYCYETSSKGGSPSFAKGVNYSYVPYVVSDAQNMRNGLAVTTSPIAGDLVCYDWDGGDYDHIGLFEDGNSTSFSAIEGNTSTSSNSNGGQVMRRARNRSEAAKVTFVRVAEP